MTMSGAGCLLRNRSHGRAIIIMGGDAWWTRCCLQHAAMTMRGGPRVSMSGDSGEWKVHALKVWQTRRYPGNRSRAKHTEPPSVNTTACTRCILSLLSHNLDDPFSSRLQCQVQPVCPSWMTPTVRCRRKSPGFLPARIRPL